MLTHPPSAIFIALQITIFNSLHKFNFVLYLYFEFFLLCFCGFGFWKTSQLCIVGKLTGGGNVAYQSSLTPTVISFTAILMTWHCAGTSNKKYPVMKFKYLF